MKWDINAIREVMKEMDKKTGLKGSTLRIELSTRMTRCKGQFKYFIKIESGQKYINRRKSMSFKFSTKLLDGRYEDRAVIAVIQHEYIHYYCAMTYSKPVHHGREFKLSCKKFNVNPDTYFKWEEIDGFCEKPKSETKSSTPPIKKMRKCYILTCVNCSHEYIRKRKSKIITSPQKYRCVYCTGKLVCTEEERYI